VVRPMNAVFMNASAKKVLLKLCETQLETPHSVLKLASYATDFAAEQVSFRGVGLVTVFWSIFQAIYRAINTHVKKINSKPHT
jgi:hypothetical protein